jgi:hypothetical protein
MITNEEFLQQQAEYQAARAVERGEELLRLATERSEWLAFVRGENRIQIAAMLIASGRHNAGGFKAAFAEADAIIEAGKS